MICSVLLCCPDGADLGSRQFATLAAHVRLTSFLQVHSLSLSGIVDSIDDANAKRLAAAAIAELRRRGRLLVCSDIHQGQCNELPSESEIGAADLVIKGRNCHCDYAKARIWLENYPLSEYVPKILETRYSQDRRLPKQEWERLVLRDLARYSRGFYIVDRVLGNSWGDVSFGQTLEWLVSYLRTRRPGCTITLVTYVSDWEKFDQLQRFCRERNIVLRNHDRRDLPHARYLISDHLALHIDAGFQLLARDEVERSEIWLRTDIAPILVQCQGAQRLTVQRY